MRLAPLNNTVVHEYVSCGGQRPPNLSRFMGRRFAMKNAPCSGGGFFFGGKVDFVNLR